MASPLCEVRDGIAGTWQSAIDGVNVVGGHTIYVRPVSVTGIETWELDLVGSDETTTTVAVTNDPVNKICSFTMPATTARTLIFKSRVNGAINAQRVVDPSLEATIGIYTLTAGSLRVLATDETIEGDSVYGYIRAINAVIRNPNGGLTPGGVSGDIQVNNGVGGLAGIPVLDPNRGGTGMTLVSLVGNAGKALVVNPGETGFSLIDLPSSNAKTFSDSTSGVETITATGSTVDVSGFPDGIYDYTTVLSARKTDGSNGAEFERRRSFRVLSGVIAEAYPEVDVMTSAPTSSPLDIDCTIATTSTTIRVDVTSNASATDIDWNGVIGPSTSLSTGAGGGQSDLLTADTWFWTPASFSDTTAKSVQKSITTTDNTEASVIELTQPDGTLVDYTATIIARNNYSESYMVDLRATYQKSSSVTREVRNLSPANEFNAWARAFIDNVSDLIRVRFIGPNGKTTKVSCILSAQQILLNGIVPTWDMTAQPWTMWLSAAYGGAPYTGRASAGTSGSVNLTFAVTPATVGPESVSGNGKTAAHFDGISKQLTTVSPTVYMADLLDASGTGSFAIALLYSANSTSGSGPKFLEDSAGAQILSIRNDPAGVGIRRWDGIAYQEVLIPATLHTKHALVCQYDSGTSTLMARLDDGDWFTTTSAGLCDLTARPVGIGTHQLDADIWELATLKNAILSQFDADGFLFWCNTYHGTAFAP